MQVAKEMQAEKHLEAQLVKQVTWLCIFILIQVNISTNTNILAT